MSAIRKQRLAALADVILRRDEPSSICARGADGSWQCANEEPCETCSVITLSEEHLDDIDSMIAEQNEVAQQWIAQRQVRLSDDNEGRTINMSLEDNEHYQRRKQEVEAARANGTLSAEEEAHFSKYQSTLRERERQAQRQEAERKAREERDQALEAEARQRLEEQAHETAVQRKMAQIEAAS